MALFDLNPTTWAALNRLLDEVLDLPTEQRADWVERLPEEYEALKPRLRSLLTHDADSRETSGQGSLPRLKGAQPPHRTDAEGDIVGPYRLLRVLGEGGMGSVWLAERHDGLVQRPVAIKFPHGLWLRGDLWDRMAKEREILASLNHPHIARLYDAGLHDDGRPYLAMEYVEGRPLDDYVKEAQLDLRSRLYLFLQVAEAIAHAHSQLVVHRDIKPNNVLVTSDGHVKLLDFGIAKLIEGGISRASEMTDISGRALTLRYASPEQVAGKSTGVASDVYSLGVVLFELLTDARPYRPASDTRAAVKEAILSQAPPLPSDVATDAVSVRALRGDLDTVILKALKKEPQERYSGVQALIDDIERHLLGYPVRARPDTALYRLGKFLRRRRFAVIATLAFVVALCAATGLALWQARIAVAEKERAEEVKEFVVSIFHRANPWEHGPEQSVIDVLEHAKTRVDERFAYKPRLRAELLMVVAQSIGEFNMHARAEEILDEAIADSTNALGPLDTATIDLRLNRLNSYVYQGKSVPMKGELDALLPFLRDNPAFPKETALQAMQFYAITASRDEKHRAAIATAKDALELSLREYGEKHIATVSLAAGLALTYLNAGDGERAVSAGKEARRLAVAFYGKAHPRVVDARSLYGRALLKAGHGEQGISVLEDVHKDSTAILGATHPLTGVVSSVLSNEYRLRGKYRRALELAEVSISILSKVKRPESPGFARRLIIRGAALNALRQSEAALADLRAGSEVFRQAFGADHPEVLRADAEYALAEARLGRIQSASATIAVVLERVDRTRDPGRVHFVHGVIRRLAGDYAEAAAAQQQALAKLSEKSDREMARRRARLESRMSEAFMQKPLDAVKRLRDGLKECEEFDGARTPEGAETHRQLSRILAELGRRRESATHLERANAFWQAVGSQTADLAPPQ